MPRALAVVVITALALAGHAARADVAPEVRSKAIGHVKQAQVYFQHEDYDRALVEYQAAFDLVAEPSLVFNIALCHDRANRPEPALEAFRRYLLLAPEGPVADEVREDIARLAPVVDRIVAERTAREEARRREEAARARPVEAPHPHESPSRIPRYLMISGAAVALGGGVSHLLAWRTRGRMADAADADAYYDDRRSFALQRNIAIGAYGLGALAIVTGLVLGHTVLAGDAQVTAAIAPDGAIVAIGWTR